MRGHHSQARAWFEAAANQGFAEAQTNLGVQFQLGLSGAQDYAAARYWYELAAAQGFAEGQYLLGQFHRDVLNDPNLGAEWFARAAQQGHAKAQNDLGIFYARLGRMDEARHWFQAAAAQGHQEAQGNLARAQGQ
jgi:TPR repeat protein